MNDLLAPRWALNATRYRWDYRFGTLRQAGGLFEKERWH
jgi:hypothetical protein